MTDRAFEIIDYAHMAAGGLVMAGFGLHWWRRGCRDPLRGSPIRANHLGAIHVWLCLAIMFTGWGVSGQIGAWLAPSGLNAAEADNWQGIFAANLTAIFNTIACLLIAKATFSGGLRGLGIGRRTLFYDAATGLAGWLAALCVTGTCVLVTQWLILRLFPTFQPPEHGVFRAIRDPGLRTWMRAMSVVGAVTIVPVGEELMFRGILQTGLQKLMPPRRGSLMHRWAAVVVVGTIFGAVHSNTPQFIPALILLGILLGFLYERTGSIVVPIIVHMLFNGKSLFWDYLARLYMQNQ